MTSVRGDFRELASIKKKLEGMAKSVAPTARAAAPKLTDAISVAVRSGLGPTGAALAPRLDGGQAFASLSGLFARVRARGLEIVAAVTRKVPRYMHRGRSAGARGGFMPPRPLIPSENDPVPEAWTKIIVASAENVLGDKAVR